jgi:hypothetical protein
MILISGPTIAALRLRTRMAENLAMRRGEYGPSFVIDGVRYVRLDEVERRTGRQFSDAQLTAAAAGLPGRLLTIAEDLDDVAAAA